MRALNLGSVLNFGNILIYFIFGKACHLFILDNVYHNKLLDYYYNKTIQLALIVSQKINMRMNIEKRKNPFGGSESIDIRVHPGQNEVAAQISSSSCFSKYIPVNEKSPFGIMWSINEPSLLDEMLEGMQKTQTTHHEFEQENFHTFYCHVCMGSLGLHDECNDLFMETAVPGHILTEVISLLFSHAKIQT